MKKFVLCLVMALLLLPIGRFEAQQQDQKVYWMATIEVPLGSLSTYHAFAADELTPLQEKYGYKFIGSWQTIIGPIEEVVVICEFDDMAAYNKARVSLTQSEEWKQIAPRLTELTRAINTRFLRATPYSAIK